MERKRLAAAVGFDLASEGRKIVICGSTWPRDERHLLPALAQVMKSDPQVCAIVAPHEPHPERIVELTDWARAHSLTVGTLSGGFGDPPPRVALIDTVGILAEVYRMGDVAYIGGSFSTGVHSVIEPAIEGLPVLFGPVHDNSFEAMCLAEAGAGFAAENEGEILVHLTRLLEDTNARREAGDAARGYVESQLGATEKCMAALQEYL
jgi:3-deoxy-D-manno-octulosonic-acid transferase